MFWTKNQNMNYVYSDVFGGTKKWWYMCSDFLKKKKSNGKIGYENDFNAKKMDFDLNI